MSTNLPGGAIELGDGPTVIRTPTDDDAPAIVDAVQRSLGTLSPWLPWAHAAYGIDQALAWVRDEIEPGSHGFVVLDDGRLAGAVGLNAIDRRNAIANLGYWLADDAMGRGHATRATKLMARHGLDSLGLHRLEVIMSVDNEPSRRVAEHAGAHYEGILRGRLLLHGRHHDAHLFAFVAD